MTFHPDNNLRGVNFIGSILRNVTLAPTESFGEVDFSNADLQGSDFSDEQFTFIVVAGESNNLTDSRFPNGLFPIVDHSNLVWDGGAMVFTSGYSLSNVRVLHPKLNNRTSAPEGDCLFQ